MKRLAKLLGGCALVLACGGFYTLDGMQIGGATLSGVLPTNETAFNYGVHVVGISYVISF